VQDLEALRVEGLTKHFGGLVALNKVTLHVGEGELVGLIGPNGSGKTTFFNCVSGFYVPDEGHVYLDGKEITGHPMEQICESGLYRSFQIPRAFRELSVLQNVLLSQPHRGERLTDVLFRRTSDKLVKRAKEFIEFVGLTPLIDEPAGNLSGGQQKLLELASVLMKNPEMILLDEPMGGVNPTLINKIIDLILELNQSGRTFLVIEHNMEVIMGIAQRLYVLDHGVLIAQGRPEEIRNNDEVLEAYFGK
jgi:ABC-type branched-subunit amino acid transport system ATPase component